MKYILGRAKTSAKKMHCQISLIYVCLFFLVWSNIKSSLGFIFVYKLKRPNWCLISVRGRCFCPVFHVKWWRASFPFVDLPFELCSLCSNVLNVKMCLQQTYENVQAAFVTTWNRKSYFFDFWKLFFVLIQKTYLYNNFQSKMLFIIMYFWCILYIVW